jgi:hypothetical protein
MAGRTRDLQRSSATPHAPRYSEKEPAAELGPARRQRHEPPGPQPERLHHLTGASGPLPPKAPKQLLSAVGSDHEADCSVDEKQADVHVLDGSQRAGARHRPAVDGDPQARDPATKTPP